MSATINKDEYRNELIETLSERKEVKNIDIVEDYGEKQLYIRLDNPESSVQIYSSMVEEIERHKHKIRFVSVLNSGYDEQLRLVVKPDLE